MPDICMCTGESCPLRDSCYRYLSEPSEYLQSYFVTPPYDGNKCDHFWQVNSEQKVKQLDKDLE